MAVRIAPPGGTADELLTAVSTTSTDSLLTSVRNGNIDDVVASIMAVSSIGRSDALARAAVRSACAAVSLDCGANGECLPPRPPSQPAPACACKNGYTGTSCSVAPTPVDAATQRGRRGPRAPSAAVAACALARAPALPPDLEACPAHATPSRRRRRAATAASLRLRSPTARGATRMPAWATPWMAVTARGRRGARAPPHARVRRWVAQMASRLARARATTRSRRARAWLASTTKRWATTAR